MLVHVELPDDLAALTDEQLEETFNQVKAAFSVIQQSYLRLNAMVGARAKVEQAATEFLTARDGDQPIVEPGSPVDQFPKWIQPKGAHDTYPLKYVVRFDRKLYRSTHPFNSWKPTDQNSQWEQISPDDTAPPPETPKANPWATGVTYSTVGQLVTFEGVTYSLIQAHTSQAGWTPKAVPALWRIAL